MLKKIASWLEMIIGTLLAICLFVGALGFLGYMIAFFVGGDTAALICDFIYKIFYKVLIYISTSATVLCFVLLYVKGDAKWTNPMRYWKAKFTNKIR